MGRRKMGDAPKFNRLGPLKRWENLKQDIEKKVNRGERLVKLTKQKERKIKAWWLWSIKKA
jgi:hypothetical protein